MLIELKGSCVAVVVSVVVTVVVTMVVAVVVVVVVQKLEKNQIFLEF